MKIEFYQRASFQFQSKESDAARLAEELGASKAREKELETQLKTEMQRLAEQLEDLEDRHKVEVINQCYTFAQSSRAFKNSFLIF